MDETQEASSNTPLGPEDTPEETRTDGGGFGGGRVRLGAVVAVLAAVAFIAWALIGGRGGDSTAPSTTTTEATGTGPVAVSAGGLATLTAALNQPIYWLGQKPNTLYEITQTAEGKVYIRYLPAGVDAGDRRPLMTVGTYPVADAFSATEAASKGQGSVAIPVGGGGVGFSGQNNPTSAYAAYPGSDYQVEVFDPTPGEARRLVGSGRVTRVPGATAPTPATAVSPAGLESAATRLGQPIYWAGPETDATYELSQTSEGRVFVRYLPPGVAVGDPRPFRTIATYPLTSAFAVTRALGKNPDTATVELDDGGIAVYDKTGRTSVYVAYPGSDYQIEVFDPTPGSAPDLVRSGTIVAVG